MTGNLAGRLPARQFIRFLVIGGINTLFGYGVFASFLFVGFHYAIAALMGTLLGVLFNFVTTGRLVFNNRNNYLIFKFVITYGIVYGLNLLGLKVFNLFRVSNYLAGAILILPTAVIAFLLNKKWVFASSD